MRKLLTVVLLIVLFCSFMPLQRVSAAITHADEVAIAIDGRPSLLCPLTANSSIFS